MKDSQLEKMSLRDLRDLGKRVDQAIVSRQSRDRAELKEKMAAMAAEAGLSLDDVVGRRRGGKTRGAQQVKYRHPDDPTLTWSGRGRKPRWLKQAGGSAERFRVA